MFHLLTYLLHLHYCALVIIVIILISPICQSIGLSCTGSKHENEKQPKTKL